MRRTSTWILWSITAVALASGCSDSGYSPNVSGTRSAPGSADGQSAGAKGSAAVAEGSPTSAADANGLAQPSTNADSQASPEQTQAATDSGEASPEATTSEQTTLAEVGVGVGRKGQAYGGNIYTAPLAANFRARERIVFDIEIKRHMNFFQAEHERLPESHEEFMTEIIQANRIQLPELPEGEEYFYDATDGELKRKIPKPPGQ